MDEFHLFFVEVNSAPEVGVVVRKPVEFPQVQFFGQGGLAGASLMPVEIPQVQFLGVVVGCGVRMPVELPQVQRSWLR